MRQQKQKLELIQQQKKLLKPSEILARTTDCKWIKGNLSDGKGGFCVVGALDYELRKLGKTRMKDMGTPGDIWWKIVKLNNTSPTHSYKESIEYLQSIGF